MFNANTGGLDALRACIASGRTPAVVSNNSADAVRAFFDRAEMPDAVKVIVGREPARPELMKPHPWPMRQALEVLGVAAGNAAFVGDTSTDLEVAAIVGTPCLAYANKPGKREQFEDAGAAVVFEDMYALADGLARTRL
ncbi:HAD family hydrolase [Actinokineospora soli]|uniref:HAD family hydrolase n=1 Tax=Actinokineospora soli TaxID=1048753 RepID=A0ABW2TH40_9PSEU